MTLQVLCALAQHPPSSYLFDAHAADCNKLASPTVEDLLEDLAEHHHVECGCAFSVGRTAWAVSCPATDEAVASFNPGNATSLSLDTPLRTLTSPVAGNISLFVSTDASNSVLPDLLASYRSKRFVLSQHADAGVYRRFGDAPQLPTPYIRNYERMCSIRGLTFVDKMAYILPLLDYLTSPCLVVIRRPAGFGKTTFLTTLECFFDVLSIHAYFPFVQSERHLDPVVAQMHRGLMVLVLDFDQLELRDNMSLDDVENECERFLDQAATNFYSKYMSYLGPYGALQGACEITLDATLHAARTQGYQIFLSVDNYTAPTKYESPGLVQLVGESIFTVMASHIRLGLIRCGAMFGDTVPYTPPWTGAGYYDKYTNDLTDDPAFSCAIGFTPGEVEALGQAMSIQLASHIVPACPDGDQDGGLPELPSPMVYCAADVLSAAHSLLSDDTLSDDRKPVAIYPALPEPSSSDSDESMDYLSIEDDYAFRDYAIALNDDESASASAPAPATVPFPEPNYVDGSDYETLWYAFVGSKYPNAKPLADMDLEKLARIAGAHATPAKSDLSSPRGSASTRSYQSFMSTMSANSDSSDPSDPPSSPTDERKIRP